MVEGKAGIYSDQFVSPSPFLLYFCPVFRAGGAFLCKKKEGQFGTIDPNMGGWGQVVPNCFYGIFDPIVAKKKFGKFTVNIPNLMKSVKLRGWVGSQF